MRKAALVTGASRGLGKTMALALADQGTDVVITYLGNAEMAKASGARGVRVNVVAPGAIETEFGGGAVRDNADINTFVASQTALGRAGVPDDIGGVVAFLCSDAPSRINGMRIEVSWDVPLKRAVAHWQDAGDVLAVWAAHAPHWFAKNPFFDATFGQFFAGFHACAVDGALAAWRSDATGALALIILLDQYPRNVFRGTAAMMPAIARLAPWPAAQSG